MRSDDKVRILIFIGSLRSGGKERRLIELLTYLKHKGFEFLVVLTEDEIHYANYHSLKISTYILPKRWKKNDITVFYQFYKVCKEFRPHIIHTWGRIQSFYAIPSIILNKCFLVNSQITSAPPDANKWTIQKLIDRINFKFSDVILSNSWAGIESYKPPKTKSMVIYNGINMARFEDLPPVSIVKAKYKIETPYTVLMSASFSPNKDHLLFLRVAERITSVRDDITFVGIGGYDDSDEFKNLLRLSSDNKRIIFPGRVSDVEALIQVCTIGVLFSNKLIHGEGISNSIMEYMSLSKAVIANDAGGTKEIVHHNVNGFLITNESEEEIADLILELIDNEKKRDQFGKQSRNLIDKSFSLESMGKAFEQIYRQAYNYKQDASAYSNNKLEVSPS